MLIYDPEGFHTPTNSERPASRINSHELATRAIMRTVEQLNSKIPMDVVRQVLAEGLGVAAANSSDPNALETAILIMRRAHERAAQYLSNKSVD
jgi:hypothetical protein